MASSDKQLPKFEELNTMRSEAIKYISSEPSIGNYYAQNDGVIFNSFKYLGVNVYPDELLGVENKDIINSYRYYEFKPSYNSKTVKVKKSAKIIEVRPPIQKGGKPRKTIRRKSKKRKTRKMRKTRK
jgi:hypothetical protein